MDEVPLSRQPSPGPGFLQRLLSTRSVLTASLILAVTTLLSKLTGFLRVQSIAHVFGADWRTDAFLTAFLVPECLYLFFTEGALSSALVPAFTAFSGSGTDGADCSGDRAGSGAVVPVDRKRCGGQALRVDRRNVLPPGGQQEEHPENAREEANASQLLSSLLFVSQLVAVPACLAIIVYRRELAAALGPDFPSRTRELAASLLAVVAAYVPFGLAGGVLQGFLNSRGHFLAPAAGPLVFNIAAVTAAYAFGCRYGIAALAWAVPLGGFLAFSIQAIMVPRLGARILARPRLDHPGLRLALRLLAPVFGAVLIVQFQVLFERMMASSLQAGSVSSLNFAYKMLNLPAGLLALTVSTALLPSLARSAQDGRWDEFEARTSTSHAILVFLVAPMAVYIYAFSVPVITLAFQRGAFDTQQCARTAAGLAWYGPSLLPMAGTFLLTRVFIAKKDSYTPAAAKAVSTALNLACLGLLVPRMGLTAIPLSFFVMYTLNYLLLVAATAGRHHLYRAAGFLAHDFRCVMTALAACTAATLFTVTPGFSLSSRLVSVAVPALAVSLLYPLLAWLTGNEAWKTIWEFIRRRRSTS